MKSNDAVSAVDRNDGWERPPAFEPSEILNFFTKDEKTKTGKVTSRIEAEFVDYREVDKDDDTGQTQHYQIATVVLISGEVPGMKLVPGERYAIFLKGHLLYGFQPAIKTPADYLMRRVRIVYEGKTGVIAKGAYKGQKCHRYDVAWEPAKEFAARVAK